MGILVLCQTGSANISIHVTQRIAIDLKNMEMTMKAIVYTKYGSPDVLHLEEVRKACPQGQ